MFRKASFTSFVAMGIMLIASCRPTPATPAIETSIPDKTGPTPEANMPNPASVFCEQNGGKLELRTDAEGGVAGICIFPDGSECDEWAYFRGECKPGGSSAEPYPAVTEPPMTPTIRIASHDLASDGCYIYRNGDFGYLFHYPAGTVVSLNDEPQASIQIGPDVVGEEWPSITISHPRDREDFRPPEGADLLQWLTEHNLIADERAPDVQIAGTTAIHLRHERSPQSYAYDRYYFASGGQLFMIVIGHTADKEDWEFYNHFLESFQFYSVK